MTPSLAVKAYPDVWLHVDAAWAGVAFVCPEYREMGQLDAINQYAHSFCTNFHKVGAPLFTSFHPSSLTRVIVGAGHV
jgi:aromatic-L-amino-acid decarboxylase